MAASITGSQREEGCSPLENKKILFKVISVGAVAPPLGYGAVTVHVRREDLQQMVQNQK